MPMNQLSSLYQQALGCAPIFTSLELTIWEVQRQAASRQLGSLLAEQSFCGLVNRSSVTVFRGSAV
eukprot:4380744-Amphidinium_carterae.1